jgi:hypothetical protein
MAVILWITVALAVAFVLVYLAARRARLLRPPIVLPPGESMPTTPLQRLSQRALVVCVLLAVAAAAIVIYHGPQVYWDNDRVRLTVMGLLMAMLFMFSFVGIRTAAWMAKGETNFDEHDRTIMAGAPAGQVGAILATLGAWIIGLAETYHDAGNVPVVYLYLIFWSCLVMSLLAWLGGIVLGYRRN